MQNDELDEDDLNEFYCIQYIFQSQQSPCNKLFQRENSAQAKMEIPDRIL